MLKQERMSYLKQFDSVYPIERIISSLSYLTAGMVGFIWLIIAALLKKSVRSFLMYHIMQSIFISIAYYIFIQLYKLVYIAFAKIPIINAFMFIINSILMSPIQYIFGLSLLQAFTSSVIVYLVCTSFMGMYSYLPWISNIIKSNTGTR